MPRKSHHTAVAVVPPQEVWEPIQVIRHCHDRQVHRWMPHLNLLYPFRPQAEFPAITPALIATCAAVKPFGVTLGEFRIFRHGLGRCTLWLAPEPAEPWRALQAALQRSFPDCDDLSRFPGGFTPHLSVGQFPSRHDCEQTRGREEASWRPITFLLSRVALLTRVGDSPFVVRECIPLAKVG